MKTKWLPLLLACALLLSAAPVAAAAGTIVVTVDGVKVNDPHAEPFMQEDIVMVPLRAAAEQAGWKVRYDPAGIGLSSGDKSAKLAIGRTTVLSGDQEIELEAAPVVIMSRTYVSLSFFSKALGLEARYDAEKMLVVIETPGSSEEKLALAVADMIVSGRMDLLWNDFFDAALQQAVPVDVLVQTWEGAAAAAGAYVGTTDVRAVSADGGYTEIAARMNFANASFNLLMAVGQDGKLAALYIQLAAADAALPAGLVEEEVVVGEGTPYELGGTLTLPAGAEGKLPAVLLVHGSGPNDRDETVGGYKPFRDIAWGLAQQGIAVLRYDKRTYVHGASISFNEDDAINVKSETVDDAIAAAQLLKSDPRIDASRVYLVGHSLGGMLAPRIDASGGDFAGLVILAGSPRTLWEIIYDQNQYALAAMDDADPAKAEGAAFVEAEYAKAKAVASMTEEEAKATTVFGIPAYYFWEMDQYDAGEIAAGLDKPILVLQGEDDFQVLADPDFKLWQEKLGGRDNVTFKLYPGLNHFFVDYSGEGEGTVNEYAVPGYVSSEVIIDIGQWIVEQ